MLTSCMEKMMFTIYVCKVAQCTYQCVSLEINILQKTYVITAMCILYRNHIILDSLF